MEKFEDYIKQEFQNFAPAPPKSVWKAIHKQIVPWYKTLLFKLSVLFFTVATITLAVILTNSISPAEYPVEKVKDSQYTGNSIQLRKPSNETITNTPHNIAKHNTQTHLTNRPERDSADKESHNIPVTKTQAQNQENENQRYYDNPFSQRKLNFDISIYPHTGCEPLTVTFTVRPPKGMDITWFIDKQIVSQDSTFQYTLDKGTHFVQLALFDKEQTILIYDTIKVYPKPTAEFEADKCRAGDTLSIRNLSLNAQSFAWDFGDGKDDTCTNPVHVYSSQGLYNITLVASNKYCSDTISHLIAIEPGEVSIIFPNAFVPDIAGPNGGCYNPNKPVSNIFHPVVRKPVKTYDLKIFDRRGKLIFHTTDINQGWDGYYRNKLVPVGVYIFVAQGLFEDGQPFTVKGDITVIYKR